MGKPEINFGLVGPTGPVGETVLGLLPHADFDVGEIRVFASEQSEGKTIEYEGEQLTLRHARSVEDFLGLHAVIVAAGGDATKTQVSKQVRPWIVGAGAVDIDKSSVFRHEEGTPLALAGVNDEVLKSVKGGDTVASPNCTTSIAMLALKPLHDLAGLKSLRAHTNQAVSGQGRAGIDETWAAAKEIMSEGPDDLISGLIRDRHPLTSKTFPVATPALNVVPSAGTELENGDTTEKRKMTDVTRKILGIDDMPIMSSNGRVFVMNVHSMSLNAEFEIDISPAEAKEAIEAAPYVRLVDKPHALMATGLDDVIVGRIRKDVTRPNTLELWAAGDNLRPGAATNGVRILERLAHQGLV